MSDTARQIHSFAIAKGNECTHLQLFKRIDLHEMLQVGFVTILDPTLDPKRLGEQVCASLDNEHMTRGQQSGRC